MDVAPGASGDVRGGGALLDIPSQAVIHLELDPSRINVRVRSFAAGSAGGQDPRMLLSQQKLGKPQKRRGKKGGRRERHRLPCRAHEHPL